MKRSSEHTVIHLSDAEKHFLIDAVKQRAALCSEQEPTYKNFHAKMAAWRQVTHEMKLKFGKKFDAYSLQKTFRELRDVNMRKRNRNQSRPRYRTVSGEEIQEKIARGERFCNVCMDVETETADVTEEHDAELVETSQSSSDTSLLTGLVDWDSVGIICSILKSFKAPDTFGAMGHLLSATLRELDALDPVTAAEFSVKVAELQLELSRAIYELKKAQRYRILS
ncbi:unnamed protein product [Cylicocyclus nassatus]|uniref:MADF domain-containing protein n=1 Tax=Cylicocyclus nassatus TaxID=53992 RepID=A0AA36GTA3_CYLNA|nr:unnamed protein product [Cylicocyclus nassatus]